MSKPVKVTGYIRENVPDPSSKASFANSNRAEQYCELLLDSGYYKFISIRVGDTLYTMNRDDPTLTTFSHEKVGS